MILRVQVDGPAADGVLVALFRRRSPDFIGSVTAAVQRQAGGRPFAYDPVAGRIQVDQSMIDLADVRTEWETRPDHDRDAWLETRIADLLTRSDATVRPADEHLVLAVRSRAEIESHRIASLRRGPHADVIPSISLTDELAITVVAEHDRLVSPITESMLTQWGLTFRDVFPIGLTSLAARPHDGWMLGEDRIAHTAIGDPHAASRFCIPGELEALDFGAPVESFVVLASHRDRAFVCPADDERAVAGLFERALSDPNRSGLLSTVPVVGRAGYWDRLELGPDHPAYLPWRRLTRMDAERSANDLAPAIQHLVGEEIFVASVVFRDSPRRGLETVTTWTEGVPCLLPKTDAIAFARSTATEPLVVPWEAAVDAVGAMMEPTMHHPPRFRVGMFPDQLELMQLAAAV